MRGQAPAAAARGRQGRVKGLTKHFENPPPEGPPRDLFDGLQKCISNNLRGNLQRFCVTPEYKKALEDFHVYAKKKK